MGLAAKPPIFLISPNPRPRYDKKALPLHTGEAGFSDSYYSHSTNSRIWKFIYHNFASKSFANMLIFHLLFLVARFLSIKIVS